MDALRFRDDTNASLLPSSYDIVTQGHGGTLEVESNEGRGAAFVVTLPDMPGIENPLPQKQPTP